MKSYEEAAKQKQRLPWVTSPQSVCIFFRSPITLETASPGWMLVFTTSVSKVLKSFSCVYTVVNRTSELATYGIGVHHAGLGLEDRRSVEELFLGGTIRVLVATSVSYYQFPQI